jgi:hypothetical protein
MMPSMPRFNTPARSHSSTPSVPKISGVAMRSTATQNGTLNNSSSVSDSMSAAPGRPKPLTRPLGGQRAKRGAIGLHV